MMGDGVCGMDGWGMDEHIRAVVWGGDGRDVMDGG